MPRKSNASKIMVFNPRKYIEQVSLAIKRVVIGKNSDEDFTGINDLWDRAVKDGIRGLDFKENLVRLPNEKFTSDLARKKALLASIKADYTYDALKSVVLVMNAMQGSKDAKVGFYYEYGTGVKTESDAPYVAWGQPNPYRGSAPNAQIVSRSRFTGMISGLYGGGLWIDETGTTRQTRSVRGGQNDEGFRKYIGDDIEPDHWFQTAYTYIKSKYGSRVIKAIQSVSLTDSRFWTVKKVFVLGRD